MIRGYTREAGVRNLEREIGALCRKVARRRAEGDETRVVITPDVVVEMLGAPTFLDEEIEDRTKDPGVAVGLAWTPAGGEVLFIEASRMQGGGSLTLTGQPRRRDEGVGADGALLVPRATRRATASIRRSTRTPKSTCTCRQARFRRTGPSAGVTMVTALASELTGPAGPRRSGDDRRDHALGARAAGRRHQGEGPRGAGATASPK